MTILCVKIRETKLFHHDFVNPSITQFAGKINLTSSGACDIIKARKKER